MRIRALDIDQLALANTIRRIADRRRAAAANPQTFPAFSYSAWGTSRQTVRTMQNPATAQDSKPKVLVMHDDADGPRLVMRLLKELGYIEIEFVDHRVVALHIVR